MQKDKKHRFSVYLFVLVWQKGHGIDHVLSFLMQSDKQKNPPHRITRHDGSVIT